MTYQTAKQSGPQMTQMAQIKAKAVRVDDRAAHLLSSAPSADRFACFT
jgi:hypothetical protein